MTTRNNDLKCIITQIISISNACHRFHETRNVEDLDRAVFLQENLNKSLKIPLDVVLAIARAYLP